MSNEITGYIPLILAQAALMQLKKNLGLVGRVYRGYDEERKTYEYGDVMKVRRPANLVTQELGNGTVQDLKTEFIQLPLTIAREVKFGVTDREIAQGGKRIIDEHIPAAAYAISSYVNSSLASLYQSVPWAYNESSSFGTTDILAARKILRDNAGTAVDELGKVHMAVESQMESNLLGLDVFQDASVQGTNPNTTLMTGTLGTRWNTEFFPCSGLPEHTGGTVTAGADQAGALTADVLKGATTIAVGSFVAGETFKAGDSIVIAGSTQRYAITADVTLTGGAGTLSISPMAQQAYTSGDVVTAEKDSSTVHAGSYYGNILFHTNAFCVAFAPLPEDTAKNVEMYSITDPDTGISIRARNSYYDASTKNVITLDVLYGVACLDPNLAVIYRRNK